jgi:hypothetical protein
MIPEGEATITLTSAKADVFVPIAYFASPKGADTDAMETKNPAGGGI